MRLATSVDHFWDAKRTLAVRDADDVLLVLTHASKGLRMTFDHVQWACALGLLGSYTKRVQKPVAKIANFFWLTGLVSSLVRSYRRSHRIRSRMEALHRQFKAERATAKALMQRQKKGLEAGSDNEGQAPTATTTTATTTPSQGGDDQDAGDATAQQDLQAALDRKEALRAEILELKAQYIAILVDMLREVCDLPVPAHALSLIPQQTTGLVGLSGTVSSIAGLYQVWLRVCFCVCVCVSVCVYLCVCASIFCTSQLLLGSSRFTLSLHPPPPPPPPSLCVPCSVVDRCGPV